MSSVETRTPRPTDRWLATTSGIMPPLEGPEGTAERLLLLLHYGIDWENGWVGNYRTTYWDRILPDRVVVATYLAPSLRTWWDQVANDLLSAPRTAHERAELASLMGEPSLPVMKALREQTTALLLRTRIVAETVRSTRAPREGNTP